MDHKIGKIIVHLAQTLSAVKEESWYIFPRKHCCVKNVFPFLETEKSSIMRWHPVGKQSWGNCGRVTLKHGLPWGFPWLTECRAQALHCPLSRANPFVPGWAAGGSLPPLGRWAGREEAEPGGAHRALSTLPCQDTIPPMLSVPLPGTDVQFFFLQQWQQYFCFYLCQEGSKGHTKAIFLSNEFLCLCTVSTKMFLLISNFWFPWFLPYSP